MRILDCESKNSIYESIQQIFGVDKGVIQKILKAISLDDHDPSQGLFERFLLSEFQKAVGKDCEIDGVYWFHLTRIPVNTSFDEGILPLGHSIDSIWAYLYSLVENRITKPQWDNFRLSVVNDMEYYYAGMYRRKFYDSYHWGPYAILIHDCAFVLPKQGHHDYLKIPEIVEDIGFCFYQQFKLNLNKLFMTSTQPAIVKFLEYSTESRYVGNALYYIYNSVHRLPKSFNVDANTCFDGCGRQVDKKNIIRIEFVDHK